MEQSAKLDPREQESKIQRKRQIRKAREACERDGAEERERERGRERERERGGGVQKRERERKRGG